MNLKRFSNADIIAGLKQGLSASADGYRRAAPFYVEARERGLDLSGFMSPVLSYLPDVASGKLDAEILVRFGGFAPVLAVAATLIPEEQSKIIASDGRVEVADANGKTRTARLADLSQPVMRQVISGGRIRTVAEQKPHVVPVRAVTPRIQIDPNEYDLRNAMDASQVLDIQKRAEKAGLTPAQYAVRIMVSHGRLKDKPAAVTRKTRADLQAAMSRRATA